MKLYQKKSEIESKQSKKNKLENLINKSDDDKNLPNFRRELREVTAEIVNLTTLEESFTNNLEIIISSLDSKNNERLDFAKQMADIIQNENDNIKFRYTLEDMIYIINECHYKNSSNEYNISNKIDRRKSFYNNKDIGNVKILEQQRLINKFNSFIMKIDEFSFLNLNSIFVENGYNSSTEVLILESNKRLKEQKDKIHLEYELLTKIEKIALETITTMANNKIKMLLEQNVLISHLNMMFKNMKNETVKYYNTKSFFKRDFNNQTSVNEEDKDYHLLNQHEKNKLRFNSYTKEIIIDFLKEAIYADDPLVKTNKMNRSIRPDIKFDKSNKYSLLLIDNLNDKDEQKKETIKIESENFEFEDLESLAVFTRKERRK